MLTCARYHNTRNMLAGGERSRQRALGACDAGSARRGAVRGTRGARGTRAAGAGRGADWPGRAALRPCAPAAGPRRRADALNSRYRRHNNCRAAACSRDGRTPYRFMARTFRESKKLIRSNAMRSTVF